MKHILAAILLFTSMSVSAWPWVHTQDFMYRSDCMEPSSTVLIYHGANGGPNITEPEELGPDIMSVIEDLVSYCTLVVVPFADRHDMQDGSDLQVWDMSDDFTHGAGAAKQQHIIDLAQKFWPDVPTYLLGGSAGAFMAYKLANERRIMGLPLDGLIMIDGASPYSISTNEYHARYEGSESTYKFTTLGMDYYESDVRYFNLGFHTWDVEWDLDTLIVNSLFDQLVHVPEKRNFAIWLGSKASQLQVNWKGEHHNIGPDGFEIVKAWFRSRLSSDIVHYSSIY